MEQRDTVAEELGLLHVVGSEEHRHPGRLPQILDALPHAVAGDGVEPDGRLVEHEQLGTVDERLGQLEPADHAAGVGAGEPVGRLGQPHHLKRFGDALAPDRPGDVEEAREPADVLAAGQRRLDRQLLRDVPDPPANRHLRPTDIEAEHLDPARLHRQERVGDPDRRRLPGAVRAEQAEDLALFDAEVDPVERGVLAIPVDEALAQECGRTRRGRGCRGGAVPGGRLCGSLMLEVCHQV